MASGQMFTHVHSESCLRTPPCSEVLFHRTRDLVGLAAGKWRGGA